MALIEAVNLTKVFKTVKKGQGFTGSVKSFISPKYNYIRALDNVSFSIDKKELVGYIGPNGAGKSTTIKMLAGILLPTSGTVKINNLIPWENRKENAKHMGLLFGQRSQLFWDLPIHDTFDLMKCVYKIPDDRYNKNISFFTELLGLDEFIDQPVRQLSLGQRIRGELALTLLHDPEILYLDEPTIGLDVVSKHKVRKFIRDINREVETTVVLTTHDMEDIEEICDRIIMIDIGAKIFDGSVQKFKHIFGGDCAITTDIRGVPEKGFTLNNLEILTIHEESIRKTFAFNENVISSSEVLTLLMQNYEVSNLSLQQARLEDIVRKVYEKH